MTLTAGTIYTTACVQISVFSKILLEQLFQLHNYICFILYMLKVQCKLQWYSALYSITQERYIHSLDI